MTETATASCPICEHTLTIEFSATAALEGRALTVELSIVDVRGCRHVDAPPDDGERIAA